MTTNISKSMIEDRVEKIAERLQVDNHNAFLRLIFSLVTGLAYEDLEPEDMVNGSGEYQIDILHIDDSSLEDSATVTLIQGTFSESLGSTKLIKMHAGLDYLLARPKADYSKLSNRSLRDRIQQFRDVRDSILPNNIRLQCYYGNLMDPSKASKEFNEQVTRIEQDYSNWTREFHFRVLGPSQLFALIDQGERRGVKVDERLKIVYDQNKANILEHSIEGVSGVICTVPAEEIARIVNTHPSVFDENLRRFRGFGGSVNKAIAKTCTTHNLSPLFWFLNNGITIVCDNLVTQKDYDNPFVDLKNLHIVNGCQTSTAIAKAQLDATLQPGTRVMVRIFCTSSPDLASNLVITTNTQNVINARELRSNDPIQIKIQAAFKQKFDMWYERTPNEFADIPRSSRKPIIPNHRIGQAYLAVVRRKPSQARGGLYKVWGDDYDRIFHDRVLPEAYLLAYNILETCKARKRKVYREFKEGNIRRAILGNGILHLARISAYSFRQSDDWTREKELVEQLDLLEDDPEILNDHFDKALKLLVEIFKKNPQFQRDPFLALKASRFDEEIDGIIYKYRLPRSKKKNKHSKK
jgi:hypothetical protein